MKEYIVYILSYIYIQYIVVVIIEINTLELTFEK